MKHVNWVSSTLTSWRYPAPIHPHAHRQARVSFSPEDFHG
jgi:hypothetical protein